jgi:TrpR-related protein YerC/YecD
VGNNKKEKIFESKLKDPRTDRLFEAILTLETEEDCYRFFEDLCTVAELKSLAQRLQVAEMLDGKLSYNSIAEESGASTATISRVKKCLNYGADGYNLVIKNLKEE